MFRSNLARMDLSPYPYGKSILRKWLKAGFIEKRVLYPTEEGTPQGGICSPVIANLTLDGLERQLSERYPKPKTGFNAKVNLVRFADDFIVTGRTKELLEQEIKSLIEQFMKERGLELSPEKTVITNIEDGFDFLGQNIRKYKGKLIIKPSRKNVATFLRKVRILIKANKQTTAGNLIIQLNPIIRGWANYAIALANLPWPASLRAVDIEAIARIGAYLLPSNKQLGRAIDRWQPRISSLLVSNGCCLCQGHRWGSSGGHLTIE